MISGQDHRDRRRRPSSRAEGKVGGFIGGVWDSIKEELGIASPFGLIPLIPWYVWALLALFAAVELGPPLVMLLTAKKAAS